MNENKKPVHASLPNFPVVDHCLIVGGIPLTTLDKQVGSTPFYVYDGRLITERVAELRQALPQKVILSYALKANPMPALVTHLAGLVDGFDVASVGELTTAMHSTMPAEQISFAGPGKRPNELREAIAAGALINIESQRELETIVQLGENLGQKPRVAVRVNPDFQLKSSGLKMGGGSVPFGMDAEVVPEVLIRLADLDLDFEGFHVFWGSQNLNADAIADAQQKTVDLAISLSKYAPSPVRILNIGGGFGIPYFPGDKPLDLAEVGRRLHVLIEKVARELSDARVVIELGRYIVGEAGIYVTRVVDKKVSRGKTFLITDGGLHHQLSASGNLGQVIRRNYPVAIGNKMDVGETEIVDIVGCLCTPFDILASNVNLPRSDVGDLIVIFQSGAYGFTASPTSFLSHPPPAEILV